MSNKLTYVLLAVFIAAAVVYTSAFVVDETEQVVVTRFGKIVREPLTDPGLNFKLPFFDKVNKFPKNLLFWDGDPGQIPTLEKTYIWVDAFARWRIIDPAVRNAVTSYRLIETVRRSNRVLDTFEVGIEKDETADDRIRYVITAGREQIMLGILKQAQPKLDKFGIELVDVKIKRINYVDQVRNSVYNRMIAERKQIAEKFRLEGVGEARKIRGNKERDLKQIESEAYRTAEEVKGKADGQAADIYARAFGVDPEFYSFLKTMEVYRETLSGDSTLVLSTDSDFLGYLKGLPDSIE
jgi:membrane protease subunit HflC